MDIPGLNEINKNDLPLILPNIIFPIFIFQVDSFEGEESNNILEFYKNYSQKYNYSYLDKICKKSFGEAIYILNKIERLKSEKDKNELIRIFRERFELNENNSLYFSSREKLIENNKYNSFYQFIEYIINDESITFIDYLKNKLETEFNIKNINYVLDESKKKRKFS